MFDLSIYKKYINIFFIKKYFFIKKIRGFNFLEISDFFSFYYFYCLKVLNKFGAMKFFNNFIIL